MIRPITYNTRLFSYILEYSMFRFDFPRFSPFVCQTRPDKNTINQEVGVAYGTVYGLGPIWLGPLFCPEVCDLFADTVLKPGRLLLQ